MSNPIIEELKVLRDEIKVQAHLLSLEAKDEFSKLEKRFSTLEPKIADTIVKFGQLNQDFWGMNESEVKSLIKDYKELKKIQSEMR